MPTADQLLRERDPGLNRILDDFMASGLTWEEYLRRLQSTQMTPAALPEPMTPVPAPPAPLPPSQSQTLVPTEQELEQLSAFGGDPLLAAQQAGFQFQPGATDIGTQQAAAFGIPPETLGTPEGKKAVDEYMKSLLLPSDVQAMAERPSVDEIYKMFREAEGYEFRDGTWVPREQEGGGGLSGLIEKIPIVGGAAALPVKGIESVLGPWQEHVVEPLAGLLGSGMQEQLATGRLGPLVSPLPAGRVERPEPIRSYQGAKQAYAAQPMPLQFLTSAVADPLSYPIAGAAFKGLGTVGKIAFRNADDAARVLQKVEGVLPEEFYIPGKAVAGGEFLTPEKLALEAAPKVKIGELAPVERKWFTPETTSKSVERIERLANAEPPVPLALEEAVTLPRTKAAITDYQRAREAAKVDVGVGQVQRVGAAEKALIDAERRLSWTLREQTGVEPLRVKIGEGGMPIQEAAAEFRAGHGIFVGGYGGTPEYFQFFDEVDDLMNRMAGYGPLNIIARPRPEPVPLKVIQEAEKVVEKAVKNAPPEVKLATKLAHSLAIRTMQKTWANLTRVERRAVLKAAGADSELAVKGWKGLDAATRADVVMQMRQISRGVLPTMEGTPPAAVVERATRVAEAVGVSPVSVDFQETVTGLTEVMREIAKRAKHVRPIITRAQHEELVSRAARLQAAREGGAVGEEYFQQGRRILKGPLTEGFVPEVEIGELLMRYWEPLMVEISTTTKLSELERWPLRAGLERLRQAALTGETTGHGWLRPNEIEKLERVAGKELADIFREGAKAPNKYLVAFGEVLNAPRAFITAFDLSAPLRQGIMLAPGHPKEFIGAFPDMLKAFASETASATVDAAIRSRPTFELRTGLGGFHAPLTGAGLTEREEAFMSRLAERIPILGGAVRRSERAYVTFLNKFRADVFDTWYYTAINGKKTLTDADIQSFNRWLNWATGRGDLPVGVANVLSPILFAPRYTVSRFQAPFAVLMATPYARKAIAKDMAAFYGTGMMMLGMTQLAGADVELDPRSTDFGKIRFGDTRLDFWGGQQQIARMMAQTVTGARKDWKGVFYDADRMTTLGRYFQGKLSPAAGLAVDILRGETFIGEELSLDGSSLKAQAFNRIVPMFIQDLTDAVNEWGPTGAVFGGLAMFGAGVQTYSSPWTQLEDARNAAAKAQGAQDFADLVDAKGYRLASDMVSQDAGVAAAQKRADDYRAAHGGFRPMADVAIPYREAQLKDDKALFNGDIQWAEWRDRRTKRSQGQAGAFNEYLAANKDKADSIAKAREELGDVFQLPADASPDTVVAAYLSLFESYKDETGTIYDEAWDSLGEDIDRFRSSLTPEQAELLDKNLAVGDSPGEIRYAELRQEIEDADWWKVKENAWGYVQTNPEALAEALSTKTNPRTAEDVAPLVEMAKAFETPEAYSKAVWKLALAQTGSAAGAAEVLAADDLLKAVGSITADARAGIVQERPEIGELAVTLGYSGDLRQELIGGVLASQGVSLEEANARLIAAGLDPIGTEKEREAALKAGPLALQDTPVVGFLKAGRATHPDEQDAQDEYDIMLKAVQGGENVAEAIRIAQSHLNAHQNALRPEVAGTDRDPYPGQPEKNQEAVAGFSQVLEALRGQLPSGGGDPRRIIAEFLQGLTSKATELLGAQGAAPTIDPKADPQGFMNQVAAGLAGKLGPLGAQLARNIPIKVNQSYSGTGDGFIAITNPFDIMDPTEPQANVAKANEGWLRHELSHLFVDQYHTADEKDKVIQQALSTRLGTEEFRYQVGRGVDEGVAATLVGAKTLEDLPEGIRWFWEGFLPSSAKPAGTQPALGGPAPAPAAAPAATTATGGGGGGGGTAATSELGPAGSMEAVLARVKGEPEFPRVGIPEVKYIIGNLAGVDFSQMPEGAMPDQLKEKFAGKNPTWQNAIDPGTWALMSSLGVQGKGQLLSTFWTMFRAGTGSILDEKVRKDKAVQAVLLGLKHYGSATVEQYVLAFNSMAKMFSDEATGAAEDEAARWRKEMIALKKKMDSQAKSAAKKAAAAAEKEAAAQAERDRWSRLLDELR